MFWTNYERFCKSVGKSANAVAADIGIKSTGTVTGWKNGATPRRSVLLKLSEYFGCEIDELDVDETTRQHEADGLSEKAKEAATLFDRAEPWVQDQILSLLRAAESSREVQGGASKE